MQERVDCGLCGREEDEEQFLYLSGVLLRRQPGRVYLPKQPTARTRGLTLVFPAGQRDVLSQGHEHHSPRPQTSQHYAKKWQH